MIEAIVDVKEEKMEDLNKFMDECLTKEHPESYLIAIMHRAQGIWGYLDRNVMNEVSIKMNIPSSHIWGVATFYHYFNLRPKGKHIISVCTGTACYIKGADKIMKAITDELGIEKGETTEDKMFSICETRCLGACGIAPLIMIDDKIYGRLNPAKAIELVNSFKK